MWEYERQEELQRVPCDHKVVPEQRIDAFTYSCQGVNLPVKHCLHSCLEGVNEKASANVVGLLSRDNPISLRCALDWGQGASQGHG